VSDVVSFKKKPKPKPAFGAGADERKTGSPPSEMLSI
jgi:hypothetical protein